MGLLLKYKAIKHLAMNEVFVKVSHKEGISYGWIDRSVLNLYKSLNFTLVPNFIQVGTDIVRSENITSLIIVNSIWRMFLKGAFK